MSGPGAKKEPELASDRARHQVSDMIFLPELVIEGAAYFKYDGAR